MAGYFVCHADGQAARPTPRLFFADPDGDPRDLQDAFLKKEARNLGLPTSRGSGSPIVVPWQQYKRLQDDYLVAALCGSELRSLVAAIASLASEGDYARLVDRFAIRRTNPDFWHHLDAMQAAHAASGEGHHGLLDLSRFENR